MTTLRLGPQWPYADPATHEWLVHLTTGLPAITRVPIESARDMARGYAWGRIDSPGYVWPSHGGDGLDFMMAYAIHVASAKCVQAVREAFDQWHSTGRIG